MTVQQRRITDLQEANVVLIRGLESAKEEADVLRQELTSSMETKENVDTRLRDLESFREGNVNLEKNVAELQVLIVNLDVCRLPLHDRDHERTIAEWH